MKVVVWSKDACGYCEQAKQLLKIKGIEFEERNITRGTWSKDQLLEAVPNARTLPQILIDEEVVGGYTELRQRLASQ